MQNIYNYGIINGIKTQSSENGGAAVQETDLSKLIVKEIAGVHRSSYGPRERWDRNLEYCQLVIRINGTTEFITENKTFMSDSQHAVFLPEGCTYKMTSSVLTDSVWIDFHVYDTGEPLEITEYHIQNVQELVKVFDRMERKRMFRKPAYRNYSMAALYELMAMVEAQSGMNGQTPARYKTVKPAVDYIEKHYSDPNLSNQMLAQVAGISEVYLRKMFVSVFGTPPARYITNIRMEKAKSLLTGGMNSVSEVAEAVGYNNIYHFSKAFKRVTGLTPTEFAKHENL